MKQHGANTGAGSRGEHLPGRSTGAPVTFQSSGPGRTAQKAPAGLWAHVRQIRWTDLPRICVSIAIGLALGCGARSPGTLVPDRLRLAVVPDQSTEQLRIKYQPLLDHLEAHLNLPCQLVVPENYDALVDAFAGGEVDLARFGGITFARAVERSNAVPLVMRDVDLYFTSYFFAHPAHPGRDLADFAGVAFSFGARSSTSGHVMPRHFLDQQGLNPEQTFAEVRYSATHDETAFRVRDGVVALGAANALIVRRMLADGRLQPDDIRIVWETPPYADYVWAAQPSLNPDLRRRVRDAFLHLSGDHPTHAALLDAVGAGGYLPATVDDFALLMEVNDRYPQEPS